MSDAAIEIIVKILDMLISLVAKQIGESTEQVRARVLKRLAEPVGDETDAVAESIADALAKLPK